MTMVDLGNPCGMTVSGEGAEELASTIDGASSGVSPGEYAEWVRLTRSGQVAPECGALVMAEFAEPNKDKHDDYGKITASVPGSYSF